MSKHSKEKKGKLGMGQRYDTWSSNNTGNFNTPALEFPEGAERFKLEKDETHYIDILPYKVGKGNMNCDAGKYHYERTFYVHGGIGKKKREYLCLDRTLNKACPICEYIARLRDNPSANEKRIRALAPRKRQLFNVIDTKDRDKGVQIWSVAFGNFGKLLKTTIDKKADKHPEWKEFAELQGGFTLELTTEQKELKSKQGGRQEFTAVARIDFEERDKDYNDDILDDTYCLDDMIKVTNYDDLKKIFEQADEEDEITIDDVKDMTTKELKRLVDDQNLKLDPDDYKTEDELRDAVIKELDLDEADEWHERGSSRDRDRDRRDEGDDRGSRRRRDEDEGEERRSSRHRDDDRDEDRHSSRKRDDDRDEERHSGRRDRDEDRGSDSGRKRKYCDGCQELMENCTCEDSSEDSRDRDRGSSRRRDDDEGEERHSSRRSRRDEGDEGVEVDNDEGRRSSSRRGREDEDEGDDRRGSRRKNGAR